VATIPQVRLYAARGIFASAKKGRTVDQAEIDRLGIKEAIRQARLSLDQGGIPIGAAMFAERTVTAARTLWSASFTLPGPSMAGAAIASPVEE
jgi:hypothetical protein